MESGYRKRMRDIAGQLKKKKSSLTASDIIESVELTNSMSIEDCVLSVLNQWTSVEPLLKTTDYHEMSKQLRILKRYVNLVILKLETSEGV